MDWPPKLPKRCPLVLHPKGYQAYIAGKNRWIAGKVPVAKALAIYHRKAAVLNAERKPVAEPERVREGRATVHYVLSRWLLDRRHHADSGELQPGTWVQYRLSSTRIDALVGHFLVDEWQPSQTESLFRRLSEDFGADFAKRAIGHFATACRHAAEREWCRPVRLGVSVVRKLTARPRAEMKWRLYTVEEIRRIIDAADKAVNEATRPYSRIAAEQLRAFIYLALNGGYGAKESSDLPKSAIDLDNARISHPRGKTGAKHVVPLWKETVESLKPVLAQRPGDTLLFRTRAGQPWCRFEPVMQGTRIVKIGGGDNVNWAFRQLVKGIGLKIDGQGFFRLRHLFSSAASSANDPDAAKVLQGHSLGVRDHYVKVDESRLRVVAEHVRHVLLGP